MYINAAHALSKIIEHRRHASKNLGGLGAGPQLRTREDSKNSNFSIACLTLIKTVASGLETKNLIMPGDYRPRQEAIVPSALKSVQLRNALASGKCTHTATCSRNALDGISLVQWLDRGGFVS